MNNLKQNNSQITHATRAIHLHRYVSVFFACVLLSACNTVPYTEKPYQSTQMLQELHERTPESPGFKAFLIAQEYPETALPISTWGTRELTLAALYFHPTLNVARAEWRAAVAQESIAAQKPLPSVSTNLQEHSQHSGGQSPWTYGLSIDIPFETRDKRQIRIDRASKLSEAAKISIANRAWLIRAQLRTTMIEVAYLKRNSQLLEKELRYRQDVLAILNKRVLAGMSSTVELNQSKLACLKAQQTYQNALSKLAIAKAKLGEALGLPNEAVSKLNIIYDTLESPPNIDSRLFADNSIIDEAMLNRLDIRAGLEKYAAAELKLKLEIAKQYPDIVLSPSYAYDQGDHIWSLGFSTLLTYLNKNQALIKEANSLRDVEAAQLLALQSNALTNVEQGMTSYEAVYKQWSESQQVLDTQQVQVQQIERQYAQGYADRLELTSAQLEAISTAIYRLNLGYQLYLAVANLENQLQKPLTPETDFTIKPNENVSTHDK